MEYVEFTFLMEWMESIESMEVTNLTDFERIHHTDRINPAGAIIDNLTICATVQPELS